MDINSILACFCAGSLDPRRPTPGPASHSYHHVMHYPGAVDEKPALVLTPPPAYYSDKPTRTPEQEAADAQAAAEIVAVLRSTDKTGAALKAELDARLGPVGAAGSWSEWLAEHIFHALRHMLGDNIDGEDTNWAVALTDAYRAARATAEDQFRDLVQEVKEHPGKVAAEVAVEVLLSLVAFGILVRMMKWAVRLLGFSATGPVRGRYLMGSL